ncbi:MAG: organomercurial lyase MerB [Actinomycetota bacterium]|nr:organomercurial lyase MerB [Actinomycetota bacterium]MDA8072864.1 organomercurial lyase MerB [Actinomycetota bacterium]
MRLLARGAPVSIDDLVAATGRPLAEVREVLTGLADLETDDQGRIVGYGLTCVPTVHRLEVNGRLLYTWCALDTLALPSVIGEAVSVESPCHATGTPVRVSVDPKEGVTNVEPATAVVSVVERCAAPSVRESFCNHVHFFVSDEAARPWLAGHPGAQIFPVGDAQQLSRSLVDALLTDDRGAARSD